MNKTTPVRRVALAALIPALLLLATGCGKSSSYQRGYEQAHSAYIRIGDEGRDSLCMNLAEINYDAGVDFDKDWFAGCDAGHDDAAQGK